MGDDWLGYATVVVVTIALVALATVVHYEGQVALGRQHARMRGGGRGAPERRIVLKGVAGLFCLHVIEIWMFGLGYWGLMQLPDTGRLAGGFTVSLLDAVYLSAVTYTTVGYGDIAPVGPIRFLAGTESLLGLMLITWSASFTFIEMSRHWRDVGGED